MYPYLYGIHYLRQNGGEVQELREYITLNCQHQGRFLPAKLTFPAHAILPSGTRLALRRDQLRPSDCCVSVRPFIYNITCHTSRAVPGYDMATRMGRPTLSVYPCSVDSHNVMPEIPRSKSYHPVPPSSGRGGQSPQISVPSTVKTYHSRAPTFKT